MIPPYEIPVNITFKGTKCNINVKITQSEKQEGTIDIEIVNNPMPRLPIYEILNYTDKNIIPEVLEKKGSDTIGLGILLEAGTCIGECEGEGAMLVRGIDEKEWKRVIKCGVSPTII